MARLAGAVIFMIMLTRASAKSLQPSPISSESLDTTSFQLWTALAHIANFGNSLNVWDNVTNFHGEAATVMREIKSFVLSQDLAHKYEQMKVEKTQTLSIQQTDHDQEMPLRTQITYQYAACATCGLSLFIVIAACIDCFI
ncbi:hypothetical protein Mapa_000788 [Marchantia paleacea]|nr:hypothetical protein Mapa_000788 [Marchantia paleacea]